MASALTFFCLLAALNVFNAQLDTDETGLSRVERKMLKEMSSTCLTKEDIEAMAGHQFPAEQAILFIHELAETAQTQVLLEELRSVLQLRPQPYDFFGNGTEQFINGSAIDSQNRELMAKGKDVRFLQSQEHRRWLPSEVATAEAFFDRRLPKIRAFIRYSLTVGGKSRVLSSTSMIQLFGNALSGFYQSLTAVRSALDSGCTPKCSRRKFIFNYGEARVMYLRIDVMNALGAFRDFLERNAESRLTDPKEQYANELEKISLTEQDVEDMNGHTYPVKIAKFTPHLASTAIEVIGREEFRGRTHLRPRPYTFDEDVDEETDPGVSYSEDVWDNLNKVLKSRKMFNLHLSRPWLPSEVQTAVNFFDRRLPVIRELFRRRLEDVVGEPIDEEASTRLYSAFRNTKYAITRAVQADLTKFGFYIY